MQGQHIRDNTVGVTGSGLLGPEELEQANIIEANTTGVSNFIGTIQFNRFAGNATAIVAVNGQKVFHNVFYRNTGYGVLVSGVSDVRIFNNTFFAPLGDNIRLQSSAGNVEIRNNILWAEAGYDIFVANDSQTGFYSDYNDLYATGAGRLVYWTKDFFDILDWQQDVFKYDLNSIGRTVIDVEWISSRSAELDAYWSEPRFYNRARDDYRVFAVTAGRRWSSPTIDAGDPRTDQGMPPEYRNLLFNPDFEYGLTGWDANAGAAVRIAGPCAVRRRAVLHRREHRSRFRPADSRPPGPGLHRGAARLPELRGRFRRPGPFGGRSHSRSRSGRDPIPRCRRRIAVFGAGAGPEPDGQLGTCWRPHTIADQHAPRRAAF